IPVLNVLLMRRSGVVGVTGEAPAKAVPRPMESTHWGEAVVRPWLPSTVTISGATRVWRTPTPITRLSAWVESAVPTSTPTDAIHVQRGEMSSPPSKRSVVAVGALRDDWAEAPEMLRLASAERCACPGDTPTPRSIPAAVWPFPSPHDAFPVGSTATSAAPRVGDHGVGNVRDTAATTGRSPSPLLENVPLLVLSDTCRTAGMAYTLNQELGSNSRTPLTARSARWPVICTTPTPTPAAIPDVAPPDDAPAT